MNEFARDVASAFPFLDATSESDLASLLAYYFVMAVLYSMLFWLCSYWWFISLFRPRSYKPCQVLYAPLRFATLFVAYCSLSTQRATGWAYAVPALTRFTSELLPEVVHSFPAQSIVEYDLDTRTIKIQGGNASFPVSPAYLRAFLPLEEADFPLVFFLTQFHTSFHSAPAFVDLAARTFRLPWVPSPMGYAKPMPAHAMVYPLWEMHMGEAVLDGNSRIDAVFTARALSGFVYEAASDNETVLLSARHQWGHPLGPQTKRVYFGGETGTTDDALAILTEYRGARILLGYSHHFREYYVKPQQAEQPQLRFGSANASQSALECEDPLLRDAEAWNSAEMCVAPVPHAYDHNDVAYQVKRHDALHWMAMLLCDFADNSSTLLRCSQQIGLDKLAALEAQFYPMLSPNSQLAIVGWTLLLFSAQSLALAWSCFLVGGLVVGMPCFVLVNFVFSHAEEVSVPVLTCVISGLRVFQFALVVYALTPYLTIVPWNATVVVACVTLNTSALLFARRQGKNESTTDREQLLRNHRKRRPGRFFSSSDAGEEATCRICLTTGPPSTMISPCLCHGSMQFVHLECLQHWRFRSANTESAARCDNCHYPYEHAPASWRDWISRLSVTLVVLCFLVDVAFVFVCACLFRAFDLLVWGAWVSHLVLGAKLAAYCEQRAWVLGELAVPLYGVERIVRVLDWVGLHLGHWVAASIACGVVGFYFGDFNALFWDFGGLPQGTLQYLYRIVFASSLFCAILCDKRCVFSNINTLITYVN
jgi:hypothetical protein